MAILQTTLPPLLLFTFLLFPFLASAQDIENLILKVEWTLMKVMGLLFVLTTVVFLWGVSMFIAKAGDEAARNKSKGIMVWGVVGMAVTATIWGVAAILVAYFQIPATPPAVLPPPVLEPVQYP